MNKKSILENAATIADIDTNAATLFLMLSKAESGNEIMSALNEYDLKVESTI